MENHFESRLSQLIDALPDGAAAQAVWQLTLATLAASESEDVQVCMDRLRELSLSQFHTYEVPPQSVRDDLTKWLSAHWSASPEFLESAMVVTACFALDKAIYARALHEYPGADKAEWESSLQQSAGGRMDPWWSMRRTELTVVLVDPPDDEAASVTLRCGDNEVIAFCHPCNLRVGDVVANRLSVLDAEVRAAYLSDWGPGEIAARSNDALERIGPYAYRGTGRVVNLEEGLVACMGFIIQMDPMYDGAVEFEISRLDVPG